TMCIGGEVWRVVFVWCNRAALRESRIAHACAWNLDHLVKDRPVSFRADLEVGPPLALVHLIVHVSHEWETDPLAALEFRNRTDVDHLVHGGREGNCGAT